MPGTLGQTSGPGAPEQGPEPPGQLQDPRARGERPEEGQRSPPQDRGEAFRRHRKIRIRKRKRFSHRRSPLQGILGRTGIVWNFNLKYLCQFWKLL